jgi:hypothetical protein
MLQIDAIINEIQTRADAATPGPWKVRHTQEPVGSTDDYVTAFEVEAKGDACWIAKFQNHKSCIATKSGSANADFCAASRTDIPRLVAALREAIDGYEELMAVGPQPYANGAVDVLRRIEAALKGDEVMPTKQEILAQLRELYPNDDMVRQAAAEWLRMMDLLGNYKNTQVLREIAAGKFDEDQK